GALALRLGLVAPAVASHIFWVGDIAGGAGLLAGGVGFLARRVRPPRLKPATHAGRRTFETGLFALGIAAVAFGLGRIALEVNVIFETLILSDVCRLVLEVGALFLGVALLTMGFGLLFTAGTVPLRHM